MFLRLSFFYRIASGLPERQFIFVIYKMWHFTSLIFLNEFEPRLNVGRANTNQQVDDQKYPQCVTNGQNDDDSEENYVRLCLLSLTLS